MWILGSQSKSHGADFSHHDSDKAEGIFGCWKFNAWILLLFFYLFFLIFFMHSFHRIAFISSTLNSESMWITSVKDVMCCRKWCSYRSTYWSSPTNQYLVFFCVIFVFKTLRTAPDGLPEDKYRCAISHLTSKNDHNSMQDHMIDCTQPPFISQSRMCIIIIFTGLRLLWNIRYSICMAHAYKDLCTLILSLKIMLMFCKDHTSSCPIRIITRQQSQYIIIIYTFVWYESLLCHTWW